MEAPRDHLRETRPALREQLLAGTYRPQPVSRYAKINMRSKETALAACEPPVADAAPQETRTATWRSDEELLAWLSKKDHPAPLPARTPQRAPRARSSRVREFRGAVPSKLDGESLVHGLLCQASALPLSSRRLATEGHDHKHRGSHCSAFRAHAGLAPASQSRRDGSRAPRGAGAHRALYRWKWGNRHRRTAHRGGAFTAGLPGARLRRDDGLPSASVAAFDSSLGERRRRPVDDGVAALESDEPAPIRSLFIVIALPGSDESKRGCVGDVGASRGAAGPPARSMSPTRSPAAKASGSSSGL